MIEEYQKIIDRLYYQNRDLSSSLQSLNNLNSKLLDFNVKLNRESTKLDSFANKVVSYYSIDEIAINKKIVKNKEDVDSVIAYVNGIVSGISENISSTSDKINNNKNKIKYYERKIKEKKS
ncbi:MAG: hypothetical protein IJK67_02795 [Bacilli bacterium]|nr:hypothetical protein [Bacilli bacterium]